jgi:TolB-like protein/class 3 adenylate cyclase/Tfp pilus assembly protein PilF
MSETRKLAAILAADVAGYARLAGADEERTLARLRAIRGDLIDPAIAAHRGRVVKRTGDGILIEFRSVVDAVRCAIEVQHGMNERNAGLSSERRIEFRVGIHLGDVVEESDGDLMGDGVNIAARLEGISEPGGICLSRAAHEQVEGKIAEGFVDLGERELKHIARRVRVFALSPSPRPRAERGSVEKTSPPHLSIVVLPFANMGGDPEQEYFVDGVTESLTTDFSRIAGSFVIARNTAFTYKGKPFDVKQIGRDLNIRYALEGSVQRGGNRLRVNVQLIDAESGAHLWAERFDKPVADLFDMQDEIVARLANTLSTELTAVEARRSERSPSPDAVELTFRGWAAMNLGISSENMARARACFESALALEPDNVEALIGLANAKILVAINMMTDDRAGHLAAAESHALKAVGLAPDSAKAHRALARAYTNTNRHAEAISEYERAIGLDRNHASAYMGIAYTKVFLGHAEETEARMAEAFRLSPRDAELSLWNFIVGWSKVGIGAYDEAVPWFRRAIEANRKYAGPHFYMAATFALQNKPEAARAAVQSGLALQPDFSLRRARGASAASDNPIYLAQRERLYEGLRLAGVPEG